MTRKFWVPLTWAIFAVLGAVADVVAQSDSLVIERVVYEVDAELLAEPILVDEALSADDDLPPEIAVVYTTLRAMKALDYEAWLATWDPEGQDYYRRRERGPVGRLPQRDRAHYVEAWREWTAGSAVYIVGLARAPAFTVVLFEIRRPDAEAPLGAPGFSMDFDEGGVMRSRFVIEDQDPHGWVLTGKYSSHPAALLWRSGVPHGTRKATAEEWTKAGPWPPY